MLLSKSFEFTAAVFSFHLYRNVWAPQLNENLDCHHEEDNLFDIFAIKIFVDCWTFTARKFTTNKVSAIQRGCYNSDPYI